MWIYQILCCYSGLKNVYIILCFCLVHNRTYYFIYFFYISRYSTSWTLSSLCSTIFCPSLNIFNVDDWKVNCLIKMYIQKLFNIFFKEINRKYCYNASMWAVQSYYMYIQEIWFTLLSSSCTTLPIISHIVHAQIKKIFPGGRPVMCVCR